MDDHLTSLITKYELEKYFEKFLNDGVTSHKHIADIDETRLRSHYHMLGADLRNFESLRNECINEYEQSAAPFLISPRSLASQISLKDPISEFASYDNAPASVRDKNVSEGAEAINVPDVSDDTKQVPEGTYLCDYYSGEPVGQLKIKQGVPHILRFPSAVAAEVDLHDIIPKYDLKPVNGFKGLGLIIVNSHFDNEEVRSGADKDIEMLSNLFEMMNLRIIPLKDLNREQCLASISAEILNAINDQVKSFFVAISSHGKDGDKFLCKENGSIKIQEIIEMLQIRPLINLPKVLIIQACRGERYDSAVEIDNIHSSQKTYLASTKESDILIAYSCVPGYVAFRDPGQGSWYIQSLLKAYNLLHKHSDFIQILTYTNYLMLSEKDFKKFGVTYKQPSQFESSLKKLYI